MLEAEVTSQLKNFGRPSPELNQILGSTPSQNFHTMIVKKFCVRWSKVSLS